MPANWFDIENAFRRLVGRVLKPPPDSRRQGARPVRASSTVPNPLFLMKHHPILNPKAALLAAGSLGLTLAHGQVREKPAGENGLIPPATPLVACDPYFSIWSQGDTLNGVETTHWTGKQH